MTTPAAPANTATGLALYRKYRSATFAELIGQEHVTRPLSNALDHGRVNHAYLFSGPRGCGKTSSARILARSLNCVQGPTSTPCGVCDSCVELAPNGPGSIDVIEIDAASHNGVDDARDLRERAWYAPVRDRFKVYIVDEAHMVTTAAFNALLKLVEEPPEFLVFVFATTEPDKVLQTIRSRTHHYPFRLVAPSVLRAHLESICARENVQYEPTVLPLVTRAGGGSVRDSLSILDQLLAGSGDEGLRYQDAVSLLGVTDAALLDTLVDALAAGDAAGVFAAVDQVVEAGHDPRRFAADLLDRLRDLLVLDAVPNAAESGLIDCPPDVLARMDDQVRRLGPATVTRHAEIVHQALVDMRGTTAPRLVLELVCARMLLPDAAGDARAVLQRLEALERRASLTAGAGPAEGAAGAVTGTRTTATAATGTQAAAAGAPAGPPRAARTVEAPGAAEPAQPVRPPSSTAGSSPATDAAAASAPSPAGSKADPAAGTAASDGSTAPSPGVSAAVGPGGAALDANRLRELWSTSVLPAVKTRSQRTAALLIDAQVTGVDGESLTLSVPYPPIAKMANEESNLSIVRAALTELIGGRWAVSVVAAASPSEPTASAASGPAATAPAASGPATAPSPPAAEAGADARPSEPPPGPNPVAPAATDNASPPVDRSSSASTHSDGDRGDRAATSPPSVGDRTAPAARPHRRVLPPDDLAPAEDLAADPRDDPDYQIGDNGADNQARRTDPEEAAVGLLRSELGARPVD